MRTLFLLAAFLVRGSLLAQEPPKDQRDIESVVGKIERLRGEARAARKAGDGEEAKKLLHQVRDLEASLKVLRDQRRRDGEEGESDELIDRIAELRKNAIRAKREGDREKAKELWGEADRLDGRLRGEMGGRVAVQDVVQDVKANAQELRNRAEALARDGRRMAEEHKRRAEELKEKAMAMAREGKKEIETELRREAEELRQSARALAREHEERAEHLRREAREMARAHERRPGRLLEPPPPPPPPGAPPPPPSPREGGRPPNAPPPPQPLDARPGPSREELRSEIEKLRNEVRELREILKKSLDERKEREEKRVLSAGF